MNYEENGLLKKAIHFFYFKLSYNIKKSPN